MSCPRRYRVARAGICPGVTVGGGALMTAPPPPDLAAAACYANSAGPVSLLSPSVGEIGDVLRGRVRTKRCGFLVPFARLCGVSLDADGAEPRDDCRIERRAELQCGFGMSRLGGTPQHSRAAEMSPFASKSFPRLTSIAISSGASVTAFAAGCGGSAARAGSGRARARAFGAAFCNGRWHDCR